MGNFFNLDNPFFTLLAKICDILFLSVVYVVLCLPVITIGPASTAMYYATVKVIRRERGYLFREFFRSFKMNFKRAAIVGVGLTIIYIILAVDLYSSWTSVKDNANMPSIFLGIYIAIGLLLTCFTIYVFPILSRFDMTIKQLIKAAAFMSMRHLPFTIVMLVVTIGSIIGFLYMPILIFILPAVSVLLNSLLMERILKKYMPKSEESEEDVSKDEWYLE